MRGSGSSSPRRKRREGGSASPLGRGSLGGGGGGDDSSNRRSCRITRRRGIDFADALRSRRGDRSTLSSAQRLHLSSEKIVRILLAAGGANQIQARKCAARKISYEKNSTHPWKC